MTDHGTLAAVHWLDACVCLPEAGESGLCAALAVGYVSIRGSALRVTPHMWGNGETDGDMEIPIAWVRGVESLTTGEALDVVTLPRDASDATPRDPEPMTV